MGDVAEFAARDQLLGQLHDRNPAVVVADVGVDAGPCHQRGDFHRLLRIPPHRLFAEDVLASGGHGRDHFTVQMVGSGHVHDVNRGVIDHVTPIGGGFRKTVGALRALGPCGEFVGANHQPRPGGSVRKAHRHLQVGAGVQVAHPSHADDADAQFVCHFPDSRWWVRTAAQLDSSADCFASASSARRTASRATPKGSAGSWPTRRPVAGQTPTRSRSSVVGG